MFFFSYKQVYDGLSLVSTFSLFSFAAIATTTAVYGVYRLVYEFECWIFGLNGLAYDFDPSYFETIAVNNYYKNFQLFPDTAVN